MTGQPSRVAWSDTACSAHVEINGNDTVVLVGRGDISVSLAEAHILSGLLDLALTWWREQADDDVVDAEIVGTVCSGKADIVQFITKSLGFPLSAWQKHYLARAFDECPDCHHWVHSFWALTGESSPCPHCGCTG